MDCERLDASAIDLVYDELDARARADAEQHLAGCARCQALVERLRAGKRAADQIELEVPSADLESRIFEAEVKARRAAPFPRRVIRMISTAGSYAMRPQVAMAAVLVVMVGISVVMLRGRVPSAHQTSQSDEGAPMKNDKSSQEQAPAQLLAQSSEPETAAEKQAPLGDKPAAIPENERPDDHAKAADDLDDIAKNDSKDLKKKSGADGEAMGGAVGHNDVLDEAKVADPSLGPTAPPVATAIATTAPAKSPVGSTTSTDYDAALAAFSAGKYADAQKGFDAAFLAGTKPSSSLLYAARSRRAQGNCADALPRFKRVLSDYASSADAPNGALEGGECARDLGDIPTAKALFTQATQYPSTKSRAEANLAALTSPKPTTMPAPAAKPPTPKATATAVIIDSDQ